MNKEKTLQEIYNNQIKDFKDNEKNKNEYEIKSEKSILSKICGLAPKSNIYITENNKLNQEIHEINTDEKSKSNFYLQQKHEKDKELAYQKKVYRADHVKNLFSNMTFPRKETSYSEAYEYTTEKKFMNIDHSFSNHCKKSFMKTYEEAKHNHKLVLRK